MIGNGKPEKRNPKFETNPKFECSNAQKNRRSVKAIFCYTSFSVWDLEFFMIRYCFGLPWRDWYKTAWLLRLNAVIS